MGLDQYAYVAARSLAEGRDADEQRDIAYWRKHGALHNWMADLWTEKWLESDSEFSGAELELTWDDLDALERAVLGKKLSHDDQWYGSVDPGRYVEKDLEFIKAARAELFMGLRVFYYPSW